MVPERLREPPDKHLNCADDFDSMVESEHSDCSAGHVSDPTTHRLINSLSRDELIDSNREISRRMTEQGQQQIMRDARYATASKSRIAVFIVSVIDLWSCVRERCGVRI